MALALYEPPKKGLKFNLSLVTSPPIDEQFKERLAHNFVTEVKKGESSVTAIGGKTSFQASAGKPTPITMQTPQKFTALAVAPEVPVVPVPMANFPKPYNPPMPIAVLTAMTPEREFMSPFLGGKLTIDYQQLSGGNDPGSDLAPRLEKFGQSGHATFWILDDKGNKIGVYKRNKHGHPALSESEVVMSNVYNLEVLIIWYSC